MTDMMTPATHLFHFDGILHWCFLIVVCMFCVGSAWVVGRVLIPLWRLACQATTMIERQIPSFAAPIHGIREIRQLQQSLQFMVEQIRAAQDREALYRNALIESREDERLRIAREIHDDTVQSLVLVAHHIERAGQAISCDPDAAMHLNNARRQLIETIDNLRQMIANLRPTLLDELGLAVAIEGLCEDHPTLEVSVKGDVYGIGHTQELAIFRAAQEAIRNAEYHAQATRIVTTLTYSASTVSLEIRDDGQGFHVPQHLQDFGIRGHYGLMGIQERIQHLGGQLNVASGLTGTHMCVTIPTT